MKKFQGKTTLIIAHRLNTIKGCDLIVVIHEGKCQKIISPSEIEEFPDQ